MSLPHSTPALRAFVVHITFYVLGVVGILGLQSVLLVAPESILFERNDVLLGTDTALRFRVLTGEIAEGLSFSHVLMEPLWSRLVQATIGVVSLAGASAPDVTGVRLLVALVAGAGVYASAALALFAGATLWRAALIFTVALLATSNVIVVVPDHFGLSFGVLGLSWLVAAAVLSVPMRFAALLVLTILAAGTTVTNGLLPGLLLILDPQIRARALSLATAHRRVTIGVFGVLVLLALPIGWVAASRLLVGDSIVTLWLRSPLEDGWLSPTLFFIAPLIGPMDFGGSSLSLSYNGLAIGSYSAMGLLAVGGWVLLLAAGIVKGLRAPCVEPMLLATGLWLLFNYVFHTFWGDELFLFAPHWVGALLVIAGIAAARLHPTLLIIASLLMIPGQVALLAAVRGALVALSGG